MDRVVIGVDPHKKSVTFEARDAREILRATGTFPTDTSGYRLLIRYAHQWPDRIWAVEGANGIGRPLAQRLLAAGERVLDVPAKLAARARVFDTGQGRSGGCARDRDGCAAGQGITGSQRRSGADGAAAVVRPPR